MKALILGSAAGGGYPQWNCCCTICTLFWQNDPRVRRRTQSSIAVSGDGQDWALINCSPDIREQISQSPQLKPQNGLRHSPIKSIVLTNGDVDHIGGLLSLREGQPFTVWASPTVLRQLRSNEIFAVLNPDIVSFHEIKSGAAFAPMAGLTILSFDVPGKVPLYQEMGDALEAGRSGHTIGLHVENGSKRLTYVPGCAAIDSQLLSDLAKTDTLLFDGTVWKDDEMKAAGVGTKTGRRMGHIPVSVLDGSLQGLSGLAARRRIFIHLNNTNPLLVDGSPQRNETEAEGWQVGFDGMDITP